MSKKRGRKLYLLIHTGYDFDPTTLAVCSTREAAEKMRREHYAVPEYADHPWNTCVILEAEIDAWVPYPADRFDVRSLGGLSPEPVI